MTDTDNLDRVFAGAHRALFGEDPPYKKCPHCGRYAHNPCMNEVDADECMNPNGECWPA